MNWKIIAVAIAFLTLSVSVIVILQEQTQSSSNPFEQIIVTNVTATPSNTVHGLVTVVAVVQNKGLQNQKVLVVMKIQEPNGNIMSLPNSSSTLVIGGWNSKTAIFEPMIPLNSKIGKFNLDIDVYDLNQTTKYYSTGFIYPFTTPIKFDFYIRYPALILNFYMVIDGQRYDTEQASFYWYLGTKHTVTLPDDIKNPNYPKFLHPLGWKLFDFGNMKVNTIQITVSSDSSTVYPIIYHEYG